MFSKITKGIISSTSDLYDKTAKGVSDISDKSIEIYDSTTDTIKKTSSSLYDNLKSIEFSKMISIGSSETTAFDTTHYFLIPDLNNAEDFTLHTYRELPFNVINESKLEKRKIFHLPNEEYFQLLKNKVLEENKNNNIKESDDHTTITLSVLKNVSNSIDTTNNVLSNGLLLVGVVACVANPIVGIAVIGSSFMPSLLSDAISGSLKGITAKLDLSSYNQMNKNAEEKAVKELEEVTPTLQVNSVLSKFYKSIKDENFEPNLEVNDESELLELTLKVVKPVYDPIINDKSFFNKKQVNNNIRNYYNVIS
jgi:hypothetical protein